MNVLRSCAAHGRNFWLAYGSKSFGGKFFCPAYMRDLFANFDPQPYPEGGLKIGGKQGDQRVRLINGSPSDFIVIGREGDTLTLRRLGFPDSDPITAQVSECYPARYIQPSTRGCSG